MINFGRLTASQIDSLENELLTATGKERLVLLDRLSSNLKRENTKRAEKLALEGIELAKRLEDSTALFTISYNLSRILTSQSRLQESIDYIIPGLNYFREKKQTRLIGRGNLLLGSTFSSKGDYSLADSLVSEAILHLEKAKDISLLSDAHTIKGHIYMYLLDYSKANRYYQESLNLVKTTSNTKSVAYPLNNLGNVQKQLGKYPQALDYYFEGLGLAEDDYAKSSLLSNISIVYLNLKDWDSALKYQKEALNINKRLGFPLGIAKSMDALVMIYIAMDNYGEALEYCQKVLTLKEQIEDKTKGIETTFTNLGIIYSKMGDYEKSSGYYERALAIFLQRNYQEGIGLSYFNIATMKCKSSRYEEALPFALKSLAIAQQLNDLRTRTSRHKLLASIYENLGNSEKLLTHQKVYHSLKDSLHNTYNVKNLRKIAKVENKHQQKRLLAENEVLKADESEILIQLQKYKWLLGTSLLLLLLSVIYYLRQKQKRKEIEEISKEKLAAAYLKTTEKDLILQKRLDQLQEMLIAQKVEYSGEERPEAPVSQEPKISLTSMSAFLIENLNTEKDWADFEHYFTRVHVDFFKELKTSFPSITPNELNLCALLRLNLLNNEIGEIMGINSDSVRQAQHRLAKKMNLSNNDALRTFLFKL